jgi:hypothetical protein
MKWCISAAPVSVAVPKGPFRSEQVFNTKDASRIFVRFWSENSHVKPPLHTRDYKRHTRRVCHVRFAASLRGGLAGQQGLCPSEHWVVECGQVLSLRRREEAVC